MQIHEAVLCVAVFVVWVLVHRAFLSTNGGAN